MSDSTIEIGDKVYRREAPGKRGTVCEICPTTGRYRVQWGSRRTWNRAEFLVKVTTSGGPEQ